MLIKAYAKINISLDILGKREDDYHLLKMIMQNIDLYDLIDIKVQEEGITLDCNVSYVPKDERNLAYKAAKLFLDTYKINKGVNIYIEKHIPVAAGLAGGSTDAAAVLKAMRDLFKVEVSDKELMDLGLKIGADIPYCILGGTALSEGIGEILTPINPFKDYILVVVKPSFGISTKEVYKRIDIDKIYTHPNTDALIHAMEKGDINFVSKNMKNVLENVTLGKHKVLRSIKREFLDMNALGTLMSGSGPSVFGFFDDMLTAQKCYDYFKKQYKEVFITRTI